MCIDKTHGFKYVALLPEKKTDQRQTTSREKVAPLNGTDKM